MKQTGHKQTLPTPAALGFPAKFSGWYPDQAQLIQQVLDTPTRMVAAVAPTGFGKSLAGLACARLLPGVSRAVYVTSTKGLQDQLSAEFASAGLVDVRGQQNYPCEALAGSLRGFRRSGRGSGCEEGPCHSGVYCAHAPDPRRPDQRPYCQYYGAVWDARQAELVSTNYAYWLTAGQYAQGLGEIDLLILDEAHDALEALERFLVFGIEERDADRLGSRLVGSDKLADWAAWARYHHPRLTMVLDTWARHPPSGPHDAHEVRRLKDLQVRLNRLRQVRPEDWLLERDRYGARFSPLSVRDQAETVLFQHVKRVLLLSATMTAETLALLGVAPADSTLLDFPSRFPVARRPVYAVQTVPGVAVTHRMHEAERHLWLRRIDRLIAARPAVKGIVHTVSYERARYLLQHSEHQSRLIFHDSQQTARAVEAFRQAEPGAVLVSPSIMTGYDFPDEDCRFQILAKVPLPDTRGPILQRRCAESPEYPFYLAMQRLVQACGRSTRSATDWSECLIVDDTFGDWFYRRAAQYAPAWWREAVQFLDHDPAPLDLSSPQ